MTSAAPVVLRTADGTRLAGLHQPGPGDHAFVVAHGFTLHTGKPGVLAVLERLGRTSSVLAYDARGHGASGGLSTVGNVEVLDLDAALATARGLGHARVTALGFSMGGSVVLRHAGLVGGPRAVVRGQRLRQLPDAVVAVSSPGRWFSRDTRPMRRVHRAVESPAGRLVARRLLRTRIDPHGWDVVPDSPLELVHQIAPVPLLLVQGDADGYVGVEHGRALHTASGGHAELWVEPGYGHAETACTPELLDRIAAWALGGTVTRADA